MIATKETTPTALYHYCSTEAFVSILTNKIIRLNAATLSNDTQEGKIVMEALVKIAEEDGLPKREIQEFDRILGHQSSVIEGMVFCLSKTKDQLSQWRGYADDANGISIGFNKDALGSLVKNFHNRAFILEVDYSNELVSLDLKRVYTELKPFIAAGALRPAYKRGLLDLRTKEEELEDIKIQTQHLINLGNHLLMSIFAQQYQFKDKAFQEENEVRILFTEFMGFGDTLDKSIVHYHRATKNCIIPYVELDFSNSSYSNIIEEITLGPRNRTPENVIRDMLFSLDLHHEDLIISRSKASYR